MRIKPFIRLLFLAVLIFNYGCDEDQNLESIQKNEHSQNHISNSELGINKNEVSIEKIPEIQAFLNSQSNSTVFNKGEAENDISIDLENILEIVDSSKARSYSFSFTPINFQTERLFNVIVNVDSLGKIKEPFVVSFFKDDLDSPSPEGNIDVYNFSSFFPNGLTNKNDCDNQYDNFGDPVRCNEINLLPSSSGGGVASGNFGSGSAATGGIRSCSTIFYTVRCNGPNRNSYHSSGACGDASSGYSGTYSVLEIKCTGGINKVQIGNSDCESCGGDLNGTLGINASMSTRIRSLIDGLNDKLNLSLADISFLNLPENWSLVEKINSFVRVHETNQKAKEFVTTLIQSSRNGDGEIAELLLYENFEEAFAKGLEQNVVACCDYDPFCCEQQFFSAPVELTASIAMGFADGSWNTFMAFVESGASDYFRGKMVRAFMEDQGVEVPSDIEYDVLGRLYKLRKRNLDIVLEPREGWLAELVDTGISLLDILAVISPSKGASAFLYVKQGGNITAKSISDYLKLISVNSRKINELIGNLKIKAVFSLDGSGKYSLVGGHHPLAKIAFESDRYYKLREAFSVSENKLLEIWKTANPNKIPPATGIHRQITGQQNSLYSNFAKTGQRLTIEKMAEIEINAMTNVGIPEDIATGWVVKALEDLKLQGVKIISNIPWNGKN